MSSFVFRILARTLSKRAAICQTFMRENKEEALAPSLTLNFELLNLERVYLQLIAGLKT